MTTPEVGDWRTPTLTVTPYDGTTTATLVIVDPTGQVTPAVPTTPDGGATWRAPAYQLTRAGEWLERWTVTGTGAGAERATVLVAPDPTAVPSGARVYATTEDYANLLRTAPPAGGRRALAEASAVVDEMLLTAWYDVDDDGLPTDTDTAAAIRDATCYQAEWAAESGDTNGTGASAAAGGFTLGRLTVQAQAAAPGVGPRGTWAPRALARLTRAGLIGQAPQEASWYGLV